MSTNDGEMPSGAMKSQVGGEMPEVDMNAPVAPGADAEGEMPSGSMTGDLAAGMPVGGMLASAIAAAGQLDGMPGNPCGCG